MDKDKAIELLNKALGCVQTDPRNCGECKRCENYATKEDGIEAIRMAISALEGKDTNVPSKWIPVSERMPDNTDTVLIVHKGGVSTGWYNGRYWERGASSNHRMLKTVTHWMPFPKAPKGE